MAERQLTIGPLEGNPGDARLIQKMLGESQAVPFRMAGGTFEAFVGRMHPDDRASVLETVASARCWRRERRLERFT